VLYDLACIQAVNARSTGKDDQRPLAEREKRAREYASAVLVLLERARRRGFFKDPKTIAVAQSPGRWGKPALIYMPGDSSRQE
jgi:hypothetical protein